MRNLKERNVDTKRKNPEEGLTSTKDLILKLSSEHDSTYHGSNKKINLTYNISYEPLGLTVTEPNLT